MAYSKSTTPLNYDEALSYAMRLCARQELYKKYIRDKLALRKALPVDIEKVIDELGKNKFIDEYRYARAFVNDKLKLSRWGMQRIISTLKQKGIPQFVITETCRGLETQELYDNGLYLAKKKIKTIKKDKPLVIQRKVYNFLAYRGYDAGMIWKILAELKVEISDTDADI
jgi:regulatory protein